MAAAGYVIATLLLLGPPGPFSKSVRSAWAVLNAGLTDSDPIKRSEALTATGSIGPSARALSRVEAGLTDKDALVRQTAAAVLGEMRSRRAVPELTTALGDQAPAVRLAAAEALWKLGDHRCRGDLIKILGGKQKTANSIVKTDIRTAERDIHNPKDLAEIGITQGAEALLGPYGIGIGAAEDLFKDKEASGRALAASLLGRDSTPASFNALVEALLDRDPVVRAAAARSLGRRANPRALPDLTPLLYDKDPAARFMAAAAIIRLNWRPSRRRRPSNGRLHGVPRRGGVAVSAS